LFSQVGLGILQGERVDTPGQRVQVVLTFPETDFKGLNLFGDVFDGRWTAMMFLRLAVADDIAFSRNMTNLEPTVWDCSTLRFIEAS
jgi:hypothetical protein